ncbi:MAG: class I SAM-dependent methyltransferase [Elusimicrobia bacterium]|nr:class I SAM-dependent methyltransferase [Elusimicrobiota bacterium]
MAADLKYSTIKSGARNVTSYAHVTKSTARFYDHILPKYDLIFPTHRREQATLARFLYRSFFCKGRVKTILDAACGNGTLLHELSSLAEYKLYGTDISWQGIAIANKLCGDRVTLRRGDWLSLQGRENFFDAVICTGNSLAHLPPQHLKRVVETFTSLLKPSGLLIADTYSDREWALCQGANVVPRSLSRDGDNYYVVAFTDKFKTLRRISYTIKGVHVIKFDGNGFPLKVDTYNVVQYLLKPTILLKGIRSTREFSQVRKFHLPSNSRFCYFVARKRES